MIVKAAAAKDGAPSALLMVFETVKGAKKSKLPLVAASNKPNPTTTPQFAVGAGKVMVALFDVVPLVPVDAVVDPVLCVPAHSVRPDVTATRA